jgi:hypothetical protein
MTFAEQALRFTAQLPSARVIAQLVRCGIAVRSVPNVGISTNYPPFVICADTSSSRHGPTRC